ncbi:Protein GOLVEN 9 [Cardamine amara subsp. amara]|uniref:Protein GOLVEN 9 n=1 Tax=Cardamine amara subsp. amara TaxID=228776 RepID=A0ABD1AGH5_CARAN
MRKSVVKLTTLVLGFLLLISLLDGLRGGSENGDLLTGRKLKALKLIGKKSVENPSLKDSMVTDLEREVDHLMKHEYPSPVKPRKRTPVHNGVPNRH